MLDEYFTPFPTIKFDFIDDVYAELGAANFYRSKTGQNRSDVSPSLRAKFQSVLPFNIYCCGFFRNVPGWIYPMHKDSYRLCALNILVADPSDKFETCCFDEKRIVVGTIPHERNIPILLNTKRFHSVVNRDPDRTRFVLSIGCVDESYEVVKAKLYDNFHPS